MPLIALPSHRYERQAWRNGGGQTREVWREGETPDWRFSLARIEADGPFSGFPGFRRELMLHRGSGLRLVGLAEGAAQLERPYARCAFDGGLAIDAQCLDGPCDVINLMYRPEAVEARLLQRPLLGPLLFFPRAGERWLVHLCGGEAQLREGGQRLELAQGDSALLFGEGGRILLEGGGELVLAQVRQREPPGPEPA